MGHSLGSRSLRVRATSVAVVGVATVVAACSSDNDAAPPGPTINMGTVATGEIPGPLSDVTDPPIPIQVDTEPPDVGIGEVGPFAANNRLLLAGDSVFEVADEGDLSCAILNPLGWTVEVDAVDKATIDFGFEVIEARMDNADFGVVGLMFGNYVDGSVEEFDAKYRELVDAIGSRPILAFTPAGKPDDENIQILNAIRVIADETPNVRIVDWGYGTQERPSELLEDGLPSAAGSTELWDLAGISLGEYTGDEGSSGGGASGFAAPSRLSQTGSSTTSAPTSSAPTASTTEPDGTTTETTSADGTQTDATETATTQVGAQAPSPSSAVEPGTCLPPTYTTATYTGSSILDE